MSKYLSYFTLEMQVEVSEAYQLSGVYHRHAAVYLESVQCYG